MVGGYPSLMNADVTVPPGVTVDAMQAHADSLARHFATMRDLAVDLDRFAILPIPSSCSLARDESATRSARGGLVLGEYVQERAATVARYLRELHRSTLEVEPERLQLDFVLMYPMLRGALENSAALNWLLKPDSSHERLERFIRVLRRDVTQFVANNKRLAAASSDAIPVASELFACLATSMETQGPLATNYLDAAANSIGIDVRASQGQVLTATPIVDVYGDGSVPHVVWRFLSDLTHFSFSVMKNSEIAQAESGEPVPVASLGLFTTTVVMAAKDALQALEQSTRPGATG